MHLDADAGPYAHQFMMTIAFALVGPSICVSSLVLGKKGAGGYGRSLLLLAIAAAVGCVLAACWLFSWMATQGAAVAASEEVLGVDVGMMANDIPMHIVGLGGVGAVLGAASLLLMVRRHRTTSR